jgi:hypothetical protein
MRLGSSGAALIVIGILLARHRRLRDVTAGTHSQPSLGIDQR